MYPYCLTALNDWLTGPCVILEDEAICVNCSVGAGAFIAAVDPWAGVVAISDDGLVSVRPARDRAGSC